MVKEELPLCSPKLVNLYELALLPLMFLLSLLDPQFPKGLLTVTQQALEAESMKLSTKLSSDPSLPRSAFGILLLACGADSGDFGGCRIEAAAYTMQLTSQGVLGFTPFIHWLITAHCLPSTRTPGHLVLLLPIKFVSLNSWW